MTGKSPQSIEAAVLLPLYGWPDDEPGLVFTERPADMRRHAGEISFPGGRRDAGESLVDTALREAHEEIGLPPESVDVLGALEPTPTFVTNYAIYPFVGLISEPAAEWILSDAEVAEVLQLRVSDLRAGATTCAAIPARSRSPAAGATPARACSTPRCARRTRRSAWRPTWSTCSARWSRRRRL